MTATVTTDIKERLHQVVDDVIAPMAIEIDQTGAFPRAGMEALGRAGLLGLISATEVGGLGQGHRAAALSVMHVARSCASTAMVLCMHYAGTAVIDRMALTGSGSGTKYRPTLLRSSLATRLSSQDFR